MRRSSGGPAPVTLDQSGQNPDGAQVDGTPAAEGEAEEDRPLAPSLLLVAQAETGADEQVVARAIGARVTSRPGQDWRW